MTGLPLSRTCSQCGAANGPGVRCTACGAALPSAMQEDGERRQLSIVFCDLVDSTLLAEELDPEELRELIGTYQRAAAAVIERYEGYVAQYLGDGILAYFGFPTAHEDDPQRAVRASLEIVQNVRRIEFAHGSGAQKALAVRVGVHAGLVVAGRMGAGERRESLALGYAPNIAARLQSLAPANSVVTSADVCHLLEGYFDFQELPTKARAGSQVVAAFQVGRPRSPRNRFEVEVARGLTPLAGRTSELELLQQRFDAAEAGRGNVVLVHGEPGIGKSRLVHEFAARVGVEGRARVLHVRCSSLLQSTPFAPIAAALSAPPFARQAGADGVSERSGETPLGPRPEVLRLLNAYFGVGDAQEFAPSGMSAMEARSEALGAVIALFVGPSATQPTLLCVEDLHWADPSTLDLLQRLAREIGATRALLVCSARTPEVLGELPGLTKLGLGPLPRALADTIVQHLSRQGTLAPETVQAIVDRTDGVPLFIEELTKSLLEAGGSAKRESVPARGGDKALPATLQDSIMARLDRLQLGKRVAQVAAVIGRDFAPALLELVAPFDEATLQQGLEELASAGLVERTGSGPTALFSFKHALTQDAAYDSLLLTLRRSYHAQIANALTTHFAELAKQHPERVAHHLAEAGLIKEAVGYWVQGAQRAVDLGADAEARVYTARARGSLAGLKDGRTRWQLELQIELIEAQLARSSSGYGSSDVEQSYTRALELCKKLGDGAEDPTDTRMLVERVRCGERFQTQAAVDTNENRLFWTMWGFGAYHQARAELRRALELGEQLVAMSNGVPSLAIEGHFGAGSTAYFMGQPQAARAQLTQGLECYERMHHVAETSPTGHHSEVLCSGYLCLTLWQLGLVDEAQAEALRAVEIARAANHPYSVAYALTISAWLQQMLQNRAEAKARADQVLSLAKQYGFQFARAWATPVVLWAEAEADVQGACVRLREFLEDYRHSGYRLAVSYFHCIQADLLLAAGSALEAALVLDRSLDALSTSDERFFHAELLRLKGEACMQLQDAAGARQSFQAAIQVARGQRARSLELRAEASFVRHFGVGDGTLSASL